MGFAGRGEHESLWRQTMRRWTEAQREEFEERAAIIEHLAGLRRDQAELAAFHVVAERALATPLPPG
jgi:hypothetical protein